jgi:hypothetical protein
VAFGEDSFQALIMALEGIRMVLENQDLDWSWIIEEGDHGFPRFVPQGFGLGFNRKIDDLIDKEISKFYKQAARVKSKKIENS